ncbi:MAG: glycosyltransferase family 4 protein [bacterium]|nr:glycosyltransferase family 4 protein [bacterium]
MKKLRIAQVGTMWETTPPKLYGGTERVLSDLTEELVKRGHKVTLFATGDSKTTAKLKHTYPRAAWRDGIHWENFLYPLEHIAHPFMHADEFDIIHVHLNRSQDYAALAFAQLVNTPTVFELHFVLPTKKDKRLEDRYKFLMRFKDSNFISISDAQRTMDLNYVATVHHGLNFNLFTEAEKPGKSLVWIGRICHEKGTKEAIEVAKKTGMNLILAGKLDMVKYGEYYEKEIKPHIDGKQIKYVGEVNDKQKIKLLQRAKVLLNPINWNEPFGLVPVEAMAMGVPVIAFDNGAMKDLIMDGKTGYVVKNVNQMVEAVKKVDSLNRKLIRQYAVSHFSAGNMVDSYEKVYEKIIRQHTRK